MPAGTGCEPGERAAMPTTARNTRLPSCGGRLIVGKKKEKDRPYRGRRSRGNRFLLVGSAADNRVATRDASRRQQTPASSVCNMPDNAIGATQADSGNRIDTSGGARLTDWKFSSPSPQLGYVEGDGQQMEPSWAGQIGEQARTTTGEPGEKKSRSSNWRCQGATEALLEHQSDRL